MELNCSVKHSSMFSSMFNVARYCILLVSTGWLTGCGGGSSSGGTQVVSGGSNSSASALSVGTAQLLETDNTYPAGYTDIASNSNGDAIAAWMQASASTITIWANRYLAGSGWQGAVLIGSGVGNMLLPRAVIDADGNCTVVWVHDNSSNDILARRYDATNGWQTVEQLESLDGDADAPQVAVDGSGNVMTVWYQSDGSHTRIYANRHTAGGSWSGAQLIDAGSYNATATRIVADAAGDFTAAFMQDDGAYYSVYATRYTVGSGWGSAQLLETTNSSTYQDIGGYSLTFGSNANGNAIALWSQVSNGYYQLHANRYVPGSGWSGDAVVDTSSYDTYLPQVAVASDGTATAVWMRNSSASSTYDITASHWSGSTWSNASIIDAGSTDAYLPVVTTDQNGNAIAAWEQLNSSGTTMNVYANRYDATDGWGTAQLIETGSGDAWAPHLAMSGSSTLAVWEQNDGTVLSIYANTLQ